MPIFRCDVVDLYVVRRALGAGHEVLQLRRAREPLAGTWQPIMGHIEPGETAVAAMLREAREEVGLDVRTVECWQLEQTYPFFIAATDTVMISPRFVVRVERAWEARLNGEHDAHRWVAMGDADRHFTWPGQLAALREIERILLPGSLQGRHLRLAFGGG